MVKTLTKEMLDSNPHTIVLTSEQFREKILLALEEHVGVVMRAPVRNIQNYLSMLAIHATDTIMCDLRGDSPLAIQEVRLKVE